MFTCIVLLLANNRHLSQCLGDLTAEKTQHNSASKNERFCNSRSTTELKYRIDNLLTWPTESSY